MANGISPLFLVLFLVSAIGAIIFFLVRTLRLQKVFVERMLIAEQAELVRQKTIHDTLYINEANENSFKKQKADIIDIHTLDEYDPSIIERIGLMLEVKLKIKDKTTFVNAFNAIVSKRTLDEKAQWLLGTPDLVFLFDQLCNKNIYPKKLWSLLNVFLATYFSIDKEGKLRSIKIKTVNKNINRLTDEKGWSKSQKEIVKLLNELIDKHD